MKIVVMNVPAHGHVNPTIAVVSELLGRGHEVIYYNTGSFRAKIEAAGAEFRPYPEEAFPEAEFIAGARGSLVRVTEILMKASTALFPFVLNELMRERPDLVLFDSICLWGCCAAKRAKLLCASSITTFVTEGLGSLFSFGEKIAFLADILPRWPRLNRAIKEYSGVLGSGQRLTRPIFPCKGDLNLVYTSAGLQPPTGFIDESFRFVGPSLPPWETSGTFDWERLGQGPVVTISLGTINNADREFYKRCLRTVSQEAGHVILVVGASIDPADLGPIPAHFSVHASIPQLEVLAHSDLFVTHAGMNGLQEALFFGVPMVLVPQQMEQRMNAKILARRGAGVFLDPGRLARHPELLAQSIREVLGQRSYRDTAARLGLELKAAGGYHRAADELEALVKRS